MKCEKDGEEAIVKMKRRVPPRPSEVLSGIAALWRGIVCLPPLHGIMHSVAEYVRSERALSFLRSGRALYAALFAGGARGDALCAVLHVKAVVGVRYVLKVMRRVLELLEVVLCVL